MRKIILVFLIMALFIGGCNTSRGVVSDIGDGTTEYRAIQEDIRAGEVELAITGARIEERSGELERSIGASQSRPEDIDRIIQRVRERELEADIFEEWRNRQPER